MISSLFSVRVIIKLPGKKDMSFSDLGFYTCSQQSEEHKLFQTPSSQLNNSKNKAVFTFSHSLCFFHFTSKQWVLTWHYFTCGGLDWCLRCIYTVWGEKGATYLEAVWYGSDSLHCGQTLTRLEWFVSVAAEMLSWKNKILVKLKEKCFVKRYLSNALSTVSD